MGLLGSALAVKPILELADDLQRYLDDPLVLQLISAGLARPDAYGLGMEATVRGALIDREGTPSSRLFGIGPIVRGAFWEISSVSDIRTQAERVAIGVLDAARRAPTAART